MYFNVVTIAQRFFMLFSCLCIVLSRETWRGKLESKSAAALTFACLKRTCLLPLWLVLSFTVLVACALRS